MFHLTLLACAIAGTFAFTEIAYPLNGTEAEAPRKDCEIRINLDFPHSVPLLVQPGTINLLYPEDGKGIVRVTNGKTVELVCAGSTVNGISKDKLTLTCRSGKLMNGKAIAKLSKLGCSKNLIHIARFTNKKCAKSKREVEIGFPVSDKRFIRLIKVCFDPILQNPLYSQHTVTKGIASQPHDVTRPTFIQDSIYNSKINLNALYHRNAQRVTVNSLLGLPAGAQDFIKDNSNYYLARGHFSPKAAFVYPIHQNATFHYVNTAPQWQSFNGGNWLTAEAAVRRLANNRHVDLTVYTGTYGIATLPHAKTRRQTPLYLYVNGSSKAIPVPKLFWKIVYEPKSKAGVALIGVNNPYLATIGDNLVCNDLAPRISWLHWQQKDAKLGYSYACTVADLRKTVSYIPALVVKSVLL